MSSGLLISTIAVSILFPLSAFADDTGFFIGANALGGMAFGSSSTTNGGAAFAGGGVVENMTFGETLGAEAHLGYRFSPYLSASFRYQHVQGDVSWDANFPLWGVASRFKGTAISNAIIGSLAYDLPISDATTVQATAGLGVSFNTLSSVVETDKATGSFLADVANKTSISPAALIGAAVLHKITPNATFGLNAAVSYSGDFATGDTRFGNLGVTSITPYKIDRVWRTNLGASMRIEF
jgi:hypothetical protein